MADLCYWCHHPLPTGFPEEGGTTTPLGYNRHGNGGVGGVTVYSPQRMLGGVITWAEIAETFRPRKQSSLF